MKSVHEVGEALFRRHVAPKLAAAVGTERRPVANMPAHHGYQLFRPDSGWRQVPVREPEFGADVFARSVVEDTVQ